MIRVWVFRHAAGSIHRKCVRESRAALRGFGIDPKKKALLVIHSSQARPNAYGVRIIKMRVFHV
jgi:hypothetical protein